MVSDFYVHHQNELWSVTRFTQALRSGVGSFSNRCQECKEQVWVQVFHIKRSRTTRKICEVTLLCGSDNSSTYLPHIFNLPYVIHTWAINNGNRTEWSPIRSVTIRVIIRIGRPRSGSRISWLRVWLQIELDDLNSCFQLVRTVTKFEKDNRHQLYVFIKKKQQLTRRNVRQNRLLSTYITCPLSY